MTEEINPLETRDPIGIIDAIIEGTSLFFKNIVPVLKMSKPALFLAIALCLALAPVFFNTAPLAITLTCSFFGLIFFIYAFWKYLISYVSVSYLAKDIYENKEIQNSSKYFEYVSKYSISYIKYWLWLWLIALVTAALFIAVVSITIWLTAAISPVMLLVGLFASLVLTILLVPFINGIYISLLSWAYGDKTKPLARIFDGIKLSYSNALSLFMFFLISGFFCLILSIIPTAIALIACNLLFIKSEMLSDLSAFIVTQWLGFFMSYLIIFIDTRYYFSLVRKEGLVKKEV